MAVLLHPDKNKCIGADGAFHLVSEAWKFLSNEFNKSTFYYKRKKHIESSTVVQKHRASSSSERLDTFWTVCTSCKVQYEYLRKYVNKRLSCKNCRGAFIAVETGPAPVNAPFHYTHPSHAPPPLHSNGYSSHSYDARMPTNSTYLLGHHYPAQGHGYEYGSYDWSSSYPETTSPGNLDLKRVSSVSNGYPYKHSKSVASMGIINKVKDGSNGTSSVKTKPDGLIYANPPGLSTHTAAVKVGRPEKKSRVFIEASVNGFVENPLMRSALVSKTTNADFKLHGQSYGSTRRWSTAPVLDTRKPLLQKARADIKQRLDSIRLASEAAAAAAAVEEDTTPVDSCKLGDVTAGRKTSGPITVPDSDFHDFDENRSEECFEPRQIWAIYDEDDGMPRLYCVVREVLSLEPFKIDIAYLSSKTDIEFGSMKWVQYGFTKSCGHFRIQNYDVVEQVNIFSHLLRGRKTGRGGCVRIFPKTGDIWAVYKNWSLNWNKSTPDELRHEYEMVEILDEYTEQYGVCIAPLVKLEGYKTVYHRSAREDGKKWIPRSEMLRFSHQVPSWFLKGATSGFPGSCWDLDPAAIPEELLHVGAEA
ncbi:hypothetical protein F2Q70_00010435 [Brassica cretica]|uniref:J domain-containing protein n=1 Tax=Brassica cretica TaxID=69181 RepID=A0A8S9LVV8_BRACR|nr:hypothetical protein F2Q70_00010435 [Brassica cretica]